MAFSITAGAAPRWMRPSVALHRVRARLRHLGAAPLVLLGFVAELGRAFFGSLGLGLRVRGGPVGGSAPLAWLAGAAAIAALAGLAAWLASPEDGRENRC